MNRNPYPGLRPFSAEQADLFFGREEQVEEVVTKLRTHRFVSVVGTSGSGKSSLIRAGVIPALTSSGEGWQVLEMRPGISPVEALRSVLHAPLEADTWIADSGLGVVQAFREGDIDQERPTLLLVDQFEEVFREDEIVARGSDAFARALIELAGNRELPVHLVITLRSDFLGECTRFEGLPELINRGQYLVPRLREDQIRDAILGPARVGGVPVSPALVEQILQDIEGDPEQLPVMQHALMRTFGQWQVDHYEGEPLGLRHYETIGTVRHALSRHADEAYAELPDEPLRLLSSRIFKAITVKGEDHRGRRRPTSIADLTAITGSTAGELARAIEPFRRGDRHFILPGAETELVATTTIDIPHESLMRLWPRLREWVSQEEASAAMYSRLLQSALLHEDGRAGLWRNPDLGNALEWRDSESPTEAWGERIRPGFPISMAFLQRSVRAAESERKSAGRRRRILRAAAIAVLLSSTALTGWALSERSTATDAVLAAVEQQEIAVAEATRATEQERRATRAQGAAERSRTMAEEQQRRAERALAESERQESIALLEKQNALEQQQKAEAARRESDESRRTAEEQRRSAVLERETAEMQRRRAEDLADSISRDRMIAVAKDLAKSVRLGEIDDAEANALVALESLRYISENGGNPQDPDVHAALFESYKRLDGNQPAVIGHSDGVRDIAWDRSGSSYLSAGSDGRVIRWRTSDGRPEVIASVPWTVRSVDVNQNGATAVGGANDSIIVRRGGGNVVAIPTTVGRIHRLFWLDTNRLLLLGHEGKVVVLTGSQRSASTSSSWSPAAGIGRPITAIAVNGSRNEIVMADDAGDIWRVRVDDRARAAKAVATGARVSALAVDERGARIAAATENGSIALWRLDGPMLFEGTIRPHSGRINAISFNGDGSLLATAGNDGRVLLFQTALWRPTIEPVVFSDHRSWVWSVAFSPDGLHLASGGVDSSVRIYPASPAAIAADLEPRIGRALTPEERERYIGTGL